MTNCYSLKPFLDVIYKIPLMAFLIACASTAYGNIATFDFESTSPSFYHGGLTVTNNGLTLTVTPEGDPRGFVVAQNPSASLLGNVAVVGSKVNPLAFDQFDPLRFSFSSSITAITFAFGDGGGDSDSPVVISAFDLLNNPLGTLTGSYGLEVGTGATLAGSFTNAAYFIATSGPHTAGSNSDSIFWEVQSVTFTPQAQVPEPASLALIVLGLAGLGFSRRKRA